MEKGQRSKQYANIEQAQALTVADMEQLQAGVRGANPKDQNVAVKKIELLCGLRVFFAARRGASASPVWPRLCVIG